MMGEKKVIKIALSLIAVGGILLGIGYLFGGFKTISYSLSGFNIIDKKDIVSKRNLISSFKNINIDVDSADVEIEKGEEFEIETVYDGSTEEISYTVSDDILNINGKCKNHTSFNITFGDDNLENHAKITIYVPNDFIISQIKLQLKTGDISLKNISLMNADIVNNFGEISMDNIKSNNVKVYGKSGDMKFNNISGNEFIVNSEYGCVNADNFEVGNLICTLKSGDIVFNNVKAGNSNINSDYGDINGTDIAFNGSNIIVKSGEVNITGELKGKNEINSEYGDINLSTSILEKDYSYDFSTKLGECSINGKNQGEECKKTDSFEDNQITAVCKCGDLEIHFKK